MAKHAFSSLSISASAASGENKQTLEMERHHLKYLELRKWLNIAPFKLDKIDQIDRWDRNHCNALKSCSHARTPCASWSRRQSGNAERSGRGAILLMRSGILIIVIIIIAKEFIFIITERSVRDAILMMSGIVHLIIIIIISKKSSDDKIMWGLVFNAFVSRCGDWKTPSWRRWCCNTARSRESKNYQND